MNRLFALLLVLPLSSAFAQGGEQKWRATNEKELRSVIPARVNVENERIETEFRTASGITDGSGKFIAGVVMITAGYSAEGKYSHFFVTQVPLKIAELDLRPGEYVFGHKRKDQETLQVSFYEAATGKHLGDVKAHLDQKKGPVRQFAITPPGGAEKPSLKIGRFMLEYSIGG
ncbi:MAG TPA: hypothetical protein VKM94_05360 [Blastocatellia bacterium]|nr:hypothetical protein [Blastocatellia bacterium]